MSFVPSDLPAANQCCVCLKLKHGRSGDEVRPGSRVTWRHGFDATGPTRLPCHQCGLANLGVVTPAFRTEALDVSTRGY